MTDIKEHYLDELPENEEDFTETSYDGPEKVRVALDVITLYYETKYQYGQNAKLNYRKLKEAIIRVDPDREYEFHAYVVTTKDPNFEITSNANFVSSLEEQGFIVKNRNFQKSKKPQTKKFIPINWNLGIAIDAIDFCNDFDTLLVVAGRGDYKYLVEKLQDKGKNVELFTLENPGYKFRPMRFDSTSYITRAEVRFSYAGDRPNQDNFESSNPEIHSDTY